MGWQGSGRWERDSKKQTVEESLSFSPGDLARSGLLGAGSPAVGQLRLLDPRTGEARASVKCHTDTRDPEGAWVRLSYTLKGGGGEVVYTVLLTYTHPHLGGRRWWFICPLTSGGWRCGRRVGKLYLPSGERHFGCRHCHDLTYESCQASHRPDSDLSPEAGG